MSAADTLRQAATRIEQVAADATTKHGRWLADSTLPDPDTEDDGGDACVMVIHNPEKDWASVLFMADWGTHVDARWIAMLGPQIAGPLAAWLRAEADDLERNWDGAEDDHAPLLLARAILGEAQ